MAHKARQAAQASWALYLSLAIIVVIMAPIQFPHLSHNFDSMRALWLAPLFTIGAIFFIGVWNDHRRERLAFFTSVLAIIALLGTIVISLFPVLVPSQQNPDAWSLTITNSASSSTSLAAMLVITLIGMPIVILYTAWVYRTFGGKISENGQY